ncbi:MAG: hypothetical protein IJX39_02650 [Clostridia bacterium]|nr:hypothetical protein [Clostridia bacterium]
MLLHFDSQKNSLDGQFEMPHWITDSGLSTDELESLVSELEQAYASKAIIKAKTLALLADKAQIAIDADDIFQDKLMGSGIMKSQRKRWENEAKERYLATETAEMRRAWKEFGAYKGEADYGHTSPNTRLLLSVGLTGLLERVEIASQKEGLSQKQKDFYESCRIVLNAVITVAGRLAEAIRPYNVENSKALLSIASGKPQNSYEAMQLLILYFFMHEYIGGTRVRTLGRLDVLLYPFYKNDTENGVYTKAEIKEMLKFFLYKFWVAKVPFDLPFCLGGIDADGNEVTNEISYLIVETYNELNIYSPKIHIRVSEKTPADFVKLVLSCIRGGNSSFVFVNDRIAIKSLMNVSIEERDARDYVPIGCYEPAVWGVEIGCTGNGGVNLPKAVELVFNNGRDLKSGALCGVETGKIDSFEAFVSAVKKQIAYMTRRAMDYVCKIERHYDEINPDPLLSCQYEHSVAQGVDVYEGGAKYNNSSLYFYSIASLTDAICAVKKLIFEQKRYTFDEFGDILRANWQGHERERAIALRLSEKYGNNNPTADAIAVEFSDFCAALINNKPNGRDGVFKAALFSVDHYLPISKRTMATPDGRLAGEPLSKNLCAVTAMDKHGVTALINSVTKMDHAKFPTGSVLDIVLHPSAVSGEDGLEAFYGILMTYMRKGGFAMHGNVFLAEDLKKAQAEPEKYQNLQVRVCGWNAYFVNLSKVEQDAFIRQAENSL